MLDAVVQPLMRFAKTPPLPRPSATPERILVLELWGIGDVILTTPMLSELRARFPAASITLLAKPVALPLLEGSGLVDEVIAFDFPWTRFHGKYAPSRWDWKALAALFRGLRARRFDLSLDARRDIRSNVVAYLSGAARRIGYDFGGGTYLLTDVVLSGNQQDHKVDDWMRLLQPVLGEVPSAGPQLLHVTEAEKSSAAAMLRQLGFGDARVTIAIHPGASHPVRRLREQVVTDVAARLVAEMDAQVLLIVDPEGYAADFTLPEGVAVIRPTIRELMAVIASVDALVCSDSAAMHIAVSLGTPATAVFGSARPDWYGPRDALHRIVVEEVACRPCFDACIFPTPVCMDAISSGRVYDALLSQLRVLAGEPKANSGALLASE